ncbi:hypothetical protein ZOSMA_82G00100 [Zostera marina]|uniref:CCR4-NOT transcription complex subunit 1 n=1 Tax=Zostera marina TaxID=29655 RepID=A0A0K9NM76_ZOSMR|nr:hypothetical protein ZOSMA_82G00100 [Zostera marina]
MGFNLSFQVEKHIRNLIQECNDSNFASVLHELCQYTEYGNEGSIFLLQTCLDQINLHAENVQTIPMKAAIVSSVLKFLMLKPNFSTVFCESLRNTWSQSDDMFLENLLKDLNLSVSEKIAISLALTDSQISEFRIRGENFFIDLIKQFCEEPYQFTSHEKIQDIITFLSKSEGLVKYVDVFTHKLSSLEKNDRLDFTFFSTFSNDLSYDSPNFLCRHLELFEECSQCNLDSVIPVKEVTSDMAEIIGELGYGFTIDSERCMGIMSFFSPLTESTIAKLLGTIGCTHVYPEDNLNIYSTFSSLFDFGTIADGTRPTSWNIDVLVESIKKLAPETNWERVVGNLDYESFYVPDENSFSFFMSIYSKLCQDPFPLHVVCGYTWKNTKGQLSFLRHAVCAPPTVFSFAHAEKKLPKIESINYPNGHGNQAWLSLDLVNVLCELAERGHSNVVREILEYPRIQCPDLLLIGLSHSDTEYNLLQYELCTTLLSDVIKNTMKSGLINHIWSAKQNLVLHGFIHTHSTDPGSIMKVFDICLELQILDRVLESTPFSFSIKLAALASQNELIDLVQWLNENFNKHKDTFSEFLRDNLANPTNGVSPVPSECSLECVNITQDSFQKVLKVLQVHLGQITSPQLSEDVKVFCSSLLSPGKQSIGAVEMASSESSSDDVDTEANTYFHQMFSGQLTVDTMIQKLALFKEYADDNREKRIFDCMIANLFEEYKFFPKYPDRQLKIAAVLFGSLIKNQLVTHLTLGIALRCVLDALRKSLDSKMFLFGAKALEQFRDRLVEWPQYCNHILQISHLRSTHAELVSFIEKALARISSSQSESNNLSVRHHQSPTLTSIENTEILQPVLPPSSYQTQPLNQALGDDRVKTTALVNNTKLATSLPSFSSPSVTYGDLVTSQKIMPPMAPAAASPSPGFLRSSVGATQTGVQRQPTHNTGFGSAINIETLVAAAESRDTQIEAPSSEIHDKILFIINNISMTNIDTKAKEINDVLNDLYYPWFAQHMVMKRASIEPNFHDLYLKFLDTINSRLLNKEILKATYENCKALLLSNRVKSSSEERSLLKNLGSWLGKCTIGRNQALRAREIDPKVLIIEAYEKGLMIAVVPFTSKILESCQFSLAYQPPNPWTMAILGLLNEIYNLPYLKMNLKFDIEVLFKNLHVDFKDVQPTSLLKDRVREIDGNPDFSTKDISTSQAPVVSESNARVMSPMNQFELQNQYTGSLHNASNMLVEDEKLNSLGIPERIPTGQAHPQAPSPTSSFTANQVLTDVISHIVINPKLIQMGFQPHLQRAIPLAVDRAVADIITAVVTRSVTISLQTTKELIQKDYSLETDDGRIRSAAKLMVSSLAGSLAHVTCKEPLRVSLSTHLRNILQGVLNSIGDLLEQAIHIITNDNLDLGCAMVEQAATDKALQSIDGEISPFLSFTKKQREGCSSPYFDVNVYAQGSFACVPESLRAKPGRLSSSQQRVYEEFVKYPWNNQSSQIPSVVPVIGQINSSSISSTPRSGQLNPGIYKMPSTSSGFVGVSQSYEFPPDAVDPNSIKMLSNSTAQSGVSDASIQHVPEIVPVVSSYSSTSTELLLTDQSILPKVYNLNFCNANTFFFANIESFH